MWMPVCFTPENLIDSIEGIVLDCCINFDRQNTSSRKPVSNICLCGSMWTLRYVSLAKIFEFIIKKKDSSCFLRSQNYRFVVLERTEICRFCSWASDSENILFLFSVCSSSVVFNLYIQRYYNIVMFVITPIGYLYKRRYGQRIYVAT